LLRAGRVAAGRSGLEDAGSALLAQRCCQGAAQLLVVGFEAADAGGGGFETAVQGRVRGALLTGDGRG